LGVKSVFFFLKGEMFPVFYSRRPASETDFGPRPSSRNAEDAKSARQRLIHPEKVSSGIMRARFQKKVTSGIRRTKGEICGKRSRKRDEARLYFSAAEVAEEFLMVYR